MRRTSSRRNLENYPKNYQNSRTQLLNSEACNFKVRAGGGIFGFSRGWRIPIPGTLPVHGARARNGPCYPSLPLQPSGINR